MKKLYWVNIEESPRIYKSYKRKIIFTNKQKTEFKLSDGRVGMVKKCDYEVFYFVPLKLNFYNKK